jgi:hypothetical protein
MADPNTVAQYIWRRARELGVNPNMALGIARFEGLNPNTLGSATYGNPDAAGYSFGPFQLYSGSRDPSKIAPGGLAYEFKEKYGAAPSKDNWQQQVDFSLETMKSRGVTPWHAVRDQGGIDAITQKGARYASQIGLDGDQTVAATAATPAAPVYSADLGTAARWLGNKIAPDMVDAPTPLTADQIAQQRSDLASYGAASKGLGGMATGLLQLAKLAEEPKQKQAPMPAAPQIVRGQFRPLPLYRGLLG